MTAQITVRTRGVKYIFDLFKVFTKTATCSEQLSNIVRENIYIFSLNTVH